MLYVEGCYTKTLYVVQVLYAWHRGPRRAHTMFARVPPFWGPVLAAGLPNYGEAG